MNEALNPEEDRLQPHTNPPTKSAQNALQLSEEKHADAIEYGAQLQIKLAEQQLSAQNLAQKSKTLEAEIHRWQHDYEQLRIQKGGFGFKALAAASFATMLFGIALGWLLFKQKQPDSIVFDQFNREAGFSLEYHVAHEEYAAAERLINRHRHDPYYTTILPQLDLLLHLVQAAKTASDSTQAQLK